MSAARLVRFAAALGLEGAVYIDPEVVTTIHPAGLPGCSTVHYGNNGCSVVLGNPDDVVAALSAPPGALIPPEAPSGAGREGIGRQRAVPTRKEGKP